MFTGSPYEICWSNPTWRETVNRAPKKRDSRANLEILPFKEKKSQTVRTLYYIMCIHIYMYIYIHIYRHIYIYRYIHIYIYVHVHVPHCPVKPFICTCWKQIATSKTPIVAGVSIHNLCLKMKTFVEFHMFWLQTGFVLLEIPIFSRNSQAKKIVKLPGMPGVSHNMDQRIKTLVAFRSKINVIDWCLLTHGWYIGYIWVVYGLYNPYHPKVFVLKYPWTHDSASESPSGNLLHSYWKKWPFIASFPKKNGDIP